MRWRDLVAAFRRAVPPAPAPAAQQADLVEIFKADRRMELKRDGRTLRRYRVSLGFAPLDHKQREGDGRTPEGLYAIDARNPRSSFHLSLRVSYPDAEDRARAAARGEDPGGDIFIHGLPNGWRKLRTPHGKRDWTAGCIAVTDAEIREVWSLVPTGVPVRIHP